MEGRSFNSGSHSFQKSKLDDECYCYCGFHGCSRYKESLKYNYFERVDAKFFGRMREVILELLEEKHQPPSTLIDELEDVKSMQAQIKGLTTLTNHLKKEVSRLKIKRNFYQALIVLFS
ncbi:hypothetical protein BT93_F1720 [Corymbia citriodora subsp. variegata]|nr:hypothetical protein BT93_F1720 [Corymbia citriodora subsp. variegata]